MRLQSTERFVKDYEGLPQRLRRQVDKALGLLLEDPRHPSLQVKKVKGSKDRWEGRVTLHYRFIFTIQGDTYLLLRVGTHDLLR